jgi:hypothetical protein
MRRYQDERTGDWWIEKGYRSGYYGWATQHINISEEYRSMKNMGIETDMERLFKDWEQTEKMEYTGWAGDLCGL